MRWLRKILFRTGTAATGPLAKSRTVREARARQRVQCAECVCWEPHKGRTDFGDCHRNAPEGALHTWPTTESHDFCGDGVLLQLTVKEEKHAD